MTARAIRVLSQVDMIAAEDTRHSRKLLQHFGIKVSILAVHEHNENKQIPRLIESLRAGKSIALISDAGTPLLSDPGYKLVRAVRAAGLPIVPIPGACAAVTALSAAGLPSDRFVFEGFPPAKAAARCRYFHERAQAPYTLIFYESPHRIVESLADMAAEFGAERQAVVARELTKKFETVQAGTLAALHEWVMQNENQRRGEFVVLIHGAATEFGEGIQADANRILRILVAALPIKQAVALAAEITGEKKNRLYQQALELRGTGQKNASS